MEIYYFVVSLTVLILAVYICWFIQRRASISKKEIAEVEKRLNNQIENCKREMITIMQNQFIPYLKSLDEENEKLKSKLEKS
jgi:hypothetical protein